ncbi:phosphopantothenoylcysteine decarboxylase (macronuclear) [Tetrahymena thermophila SB210]|uniref:Phosphopantothenoylcysteine decarboxylase n=1 Tax=Tetrahymena thermophila (strain SB210) TaxID=312017 RepID=I7LUP7_TETTS|nr:phosphopantothenoylcysteine decarboxylase [Tetrahymena thermophila SB210]EAR95652.2 phosphopantothenoylcysteine decarboxylase [Tetrahymena thermophila SB210]|eukprot:XP_001015897.2 phosphopantothenoylcysteine decarboxylase [Tetrahymena thermophila SB210]
MDSLNNKILNKREHKKNLLIGISGSVATIKIAELVENLSKANLFDIRIVTTEKAMTFLDNHLQEKLSNVQIFTDKDEWGQWKKKGDPVLHIDLRKWADIFLIAPLSANTLSKIATGACDNLLTCVARAWDFDLKQDRTFDLADQKSLRLLKKPFIVAPAMNTFMYQHPITEKQINQLKEWNIIVLPTVEKILVCGDKGLGAMAEVLTICDSIKIIKQQLDQN